MKQKHHQSGLSLVEITVVVLLMSILIVSVIYGMQIVQNAKVKSFMTQANLYQVAANSFRKQYGTWPGDFGQARNRIHGCDAARECADGNGDQIISSSANTWDCRMPGFTTGDQPFPCNPGSLTGANLLGTNSEITQFWRHLALSGLIDNLRMRPGRYGWGDSMPRSRLAAGIQILYEGNRWNNYVNGLTGHFLILQREPLELHPNMAGTDAASSVSTAWALDTEMDDGLPNTGNFRTVGQNGCGGPGQPNNYTDAAGSGRRSCTFFYKFDP